MDNLYLRMQRLDKSREAELMAFSGASVWLTNMTLQGDGPRGAARALWPYRNAMVRISDSTILDWNGTSSPLALIENNSSLSIASSALRDISTTGNSAAVSARDVANFTPSTAAVTASSLTRVVSPFFALERPGAARFYSDGGLLVRGADGETEEAARLPATQSGTPLLPAAGNPILTSVDAALDDYNASEASDADGLDYAIAPGPASAEAPAFILPPEGLPLLPPPSARPPDALPSLGPPLPPPAEDSSDSGPSTAVIIGAALGAVAAVAVVLAAVLALKRKRKSAMAAVPLPPPEPAGQVALPPAAAHAVHDPRSGPYYPHAYPPLPAPAVHAVHAATPVHAMASLVHRIGAAAVGQPLAGTAPRGSDAPSGSMADAEASSAALESLEAALDAMHSTQAPFCHHYRLSSSINRHVGSQGIVQFASFDNGRRTAAVKFYTHRAAFDTECAAHAEPPLRDLMHATIAIEDNAGGAWRAPNGYAFPPFIIMQEATSIGDFYRPMHEPASPRYIGFEVLINCARALEKLHATGWAHGNVKPSNILRLNVGLDWTLIDFGCAAQIGKTAPLTFSLSYAPPEVALLVEAGARSAPAAAAADVWAVGVMGFELLTGERVFPAAAEPPQPEEGPDPEVLAALTGRAPLPWEAAAPGAAMRLQKLRGLKDTLLWCLERDPAKRPTAQALLAMCDHISEESTARLLTVLNG